jgi:hypothetical protein
MENGNWKLEIGNWKMETGKWKMENRIRGWESNHVPLLDKGGVRGG